MIQYEIDLPTEEDKIGFTIMDDDEFTIPYIIDTITNSLEGHQLLSHANENFWIIDINGEGPITTKVALDE